MSEKAQGQAVQAEESFVESVLGTRPASHGWNHSDPGNPAIVRCTYDLEGNLVSEEEVNTDDEIQACLPGTRIYDVIDKVQQGFVPVYQEGAEYMDLTEQPETDGEALKIAKQAMSELAKMKKAAAQKELEAKVEKKEETREMETTLDYKAEYEKLKALMEKQNG